MANQPKDYERGIAKAMAALVCCADVALESSRVSLA